MAEVYFMIKTNGCHFVEDFQIIALEDFPIFEFH